MNPVENKQPSEWAKELADEFFDLRLHEAAKRFDEIRAEIEAPLKSQADGLAKSMQRIKNNASSAMSFEMIECEIIEALEAYRKGKI